MSRKHPFRATPLSVLRSVAAPRRTLLESHILGLAQQHGIDSSGLPAGSLLTGDHPGPAQQRLAGIIRALRQALGDELLGMTAHPVPPGTFDVGTKSALLSRHLGAFLCELIAAAELMYSPPDLHCQLVVADGEAALVFENRHAPRAAPYFTYGLLATQRGLSWLIDEPLRPARVELHARGPRLRADLQALFRCEVRLGAARNALVFEERWLAATIRRGADEVQDYLRRRPLDILYQPGQDRSLPEALLRLLRQRIAGGEGSADPGWAAAALGLSASQLRRALARESCSFLQLKQRARFELAAQALADPDVPLAQIAEQLGFRETNSFFRAFKQWARVSPQTYRRRLARAR